jgi:RNA polymerase sigma-70 factor (ECF subfamily)
MDKDPKRMMVGTASKYHKTETQLQEEHFLVERAKQDPARFEPLYNAYYEQIFRYIYQRIDDKETAFDLCAQVFLKAMSNLHKYEFRGVPFSSWLYRIAQNEVYEALRNQQAHRTVALETRQVKDMLEELETGFTEEQFDLLKKVLPELPEEDLQMIEWRFFEKRSFREIGDILGITENNAKVRGHRSLEKLKRLFKSNIRE